MDNNGWIKLHRSLVRWEWFSESKTAHFMLYCLLKASHKDTRYKGRLIKAGSFWFGRKKASKECGLSEQSIRTCINKLKSTNEITIKSSSQGSIISITNWHKYQDDQREQPTKQQTSNQRSTTYNNVNNIKKYKGELLSLFSDDEIITWLSDSPNPKILDQLYNKYEHTALKEEIETAYNWQLENKKRKAGTYLSSWLKRSGLKDISKDFEFEKAISSLGKKVESDE